MIDNIHKYIGTHFGKDCLELTRNFEKTSRKLADHRNHLRFNLRCLHTGVVPRSLWIKQRVKGYRADKIIAKAQKDLLNERIRQNNFTINVLKGKVDCIADELSKRLPGDVYQQVSEFTVRGQLAQHRKSKERQQQKYTRLISFGSRADRDKNWRVKNVVDKNEPVKERWVKNLSSRALAADEKDILSRGLNFAVVPDRIPHVELITATESAIKRNQLDIAEAEELRAQVTSCLVNAKLPPSNITKGQREAITSLSKDRNILVLPADKGRCTVVLDKSDYAEKVESLLNDTKVYELLKKDPTAIYKKKVIDNLQQLEKAEVIDRALYHKLYPAESVPSFYGLPKVHKQNNPLRPIVSSIDSVTYNVAKHLAEIIGPLVGQSCHHVTNSSDFVEKIKDIEVDADETITSYDVSALFTCIPPEGVVEVVKEFLLADTKLSDRTKLSPEQICSLLELCLNSTYFAYDGKFYKAYLMIEGASTIVVYGKHIFLYNFLWPLYWKP